MHPSLIRDFWVIWKFLSKRFRGKRFLIEFDDAMHSKSSSQQLFQIFPTVTECWNGSFDTWAVTFESLRDRFVQNDSIDVSRDDHFLSSFKFSSLSDGVDNSVTSSLMLNATVRVFQRLKNFIKYVLINKK